MSKSSKCIVVHQRYILVFMCFIATIIALSLQDSIAVMFNELSESSPHNYVKENPCLRDSQLNVHVQYMETKQKDHNILVEYAIRLSPILPFFGELLTSIPSGILADKYGGKYVLAISILFNGIISILTPWAINNYGSSSVLILQFFLGCCSGCIQPAINSLMSRWVPLTERARSAVIIYSGIHFAFALSYFTPAFIDNNYKNLLPINYYRGIFACAWFLIFIILCYNNPIEHPFITKKEIEYLEYEMVHLSLDTRSLKIPWREFIFTGPMSAYYIASIGNSWGRGILLVAVPNYYVHMLRFTYDEMIVRFAFNYICMVFITVITGFICDYMTIDSALGITWIRRLWTIIALVGPGMFMVCAAYADCNTLATNILFTICSGLFGCWYSGIKLNSLDLAPNFSGTIIGIVNSISRITILLVKPISRMIVKNNNSSDWRSLYDVTCLILCVSAFYVTFMGSAEIQDWNDSYIKTENQINNLKKKNQGYKK